MASPKKKPNRPRSKAAQHTLNTREERQRERALDGIEAHPDAVVFESRGTVDDATYRRQLDGPNLAEERRMWRNLILLVIAVAVPTLMVILRIV